MATYSFEFSTKGIREMYSFFDNLEKILTSKELYEYIAKKCIEELYKISSERLTTYDKEDIDLSYYVSRHQYQIKGDIITIFNDSKIDISSKNMREETKARYPAQLSLAKIVEYGIGYTGANFTTIPADSVLPNDDWKYDVNNHGYKGWYFTDDDGEVVWTNGFEGRLIFNELVNRIKQNANGWINEYIKKKIKR